MIRSKEFVALAKAYGVPDLDIDFVEITPEMAETILETKNMNNRPLQTRYAQELVEERRAGRWIVNGSTICFDVDGNLIDGQHRLKQICMSEEAQACIVVKGLPSEAFATKDNNKTRSPATVLGLSGGLKASHSSTAALAIRLLYAYDAGNLKSSQGLKLTPAATLELFNTKYRDIVKSIEFTKGMATRTFTPAHVLAAAHFIFSRQNKPIAETFLQQLATKVNVPEKSPVLALFNRLQAYHNITGPGKPVKKVGHSMLGLYINAWNAYRKGRLITFKALPMPVDREDYERALA